MVHDIIAFTCSSVIFFMRREYGTPKVTVCGAVSSPYTLSGADGGIVVYKEGECDFQGVDVITNTD